MTGNPKITKAVVKHLLTAKDLTQALIDENIVSEDGLHYQLVKGSRKQKAIELKADGFSNRQIAKALGVDHHTVAKDLSGEFSPLFGENSPLTPTEQATETRRANEAARKAAFGRPVPDLPNGLHQGDFRELSPLNIADETVDLVFTDPPYHRETLHLYEDAAKEAARILKPGGSMICYCGHLILPQVLPRMRSHLKYQWIGAEVHTGQMARMTEYGIVVGFKPLLWFVKKYRYDKDVFVLDTVVGQQEKNAHPWQQSVKAAEHFISLLTPENGIVVDFMAGGGTTIVAAKNIGRQWVAFEIDADASAKIAERLAA